MLEQWEQVDLQSKLRDIERGLSLQRRRLRILQRAARLSAARCLRALARPAPLACSRARAPPVARLAPPCVLRCTMRAMGRIFEVRKHTMFARWNRMAKQFARIAKDITIAVKSGGTDPASNPTLRRVIQNARAVNMPKDKVEAAIKRAAGRDAANYQEVLYEGYAPARRGAAGGDRHRQPDAHRRRACATSSPRAAATSPPTAASASCSARWACSA